MAVTRPRSSANRRGRSRRVTGVLVSAGLVLSLAACAGDDDDDAAGDDASAEADAAIATLEADLETAESQVASLEEERDELVAELDAVSEVDDEEITRLEDELALVQVQADANLERAETAEALVAEIETVIGQFPIALDSSLIPEDMPGAYNITFEEAYCDTFEFCGTVPGPTTAEIYYDGQQFLRIGVTGILDAGLFALSGSLYGITDSDTAVAPCGETPRTARITMSLYADNVEVLEDGSRVVKDVNADITIDSRGAGEGCPGGLVFYAAQLVPVG